MSSKVSWPRPPGGCKSCLLPDLAIELFLVESAISSPPQTSTTCRDCPTLEEVHYQIRQLSSSTARHSVLQLRYVTGDDAEDTVELVITECTGRPHCEPRQGTT